MTLDEKERSSWQRGRRSYGIRFYSDCYRNLNLRAYGEIMVSSHWCGRVSDNPLGAVGGHFFDLFGIAADVKVEESHIPAGGSAIGEGKV